MDTSAHYPPLDTTGVRFRSVMNLPAGLEIYDFTKGYDPNRELDSPYGVGRYDERRPGMYLGEQFTAGARDLHVGIDLAAPAGTAVFSFYEGTIFKLGDNALPYDYGPTIITAHEWLGQKVYALYGHLSRESLEMWRPGDRVQAGATIGALGSPEVNGGWNPHLHFQLSLLEPVTHDLPGAVSLDDRAWALRAFPDPRKVLGALY